MEPLTAGLSQELSIVVTPDRTAKHLETGSASVLSTPSMVWLGEHNPQTLAQEHLPGDRRDVLDGSRDR